MSYIDGFVIAVPTGKQQQFIAHANTVDSAFIDHGATRVVECWGADVPKGKTTDFQGAVAAQDDETVAFSWIEWPDKATRDGVMGRMDELAKTDERCDPAKNPMPFDGKRMIYGGFEPIVEQGGAAADSYVQGFVIPVPAGKREDYRKMAEEQGDEAVLKVQHWLQSTGAREVNLALMADCAGLEQRTFLRRFRAATATLSEALAHGGMAHNVKVNLDWVDSQIFENDAEAVARLEKVNGILVPGGFGERGTEGKIHAVKFARERKVPYFGICFGMQMAVIEAARSLAGIDRAGSSEFGPTPEPVVGLMTEWTQGNQRVLRQQGGDMGGTMRLGAYDSTLKAGSKIAEMYGSTTISERHRHRYEVNINYREAIEQKAGLIFAGLSPDGVLPETVEREDHPWFVGVQYHPELKSRPFAPHPLFAGFIEAALVQSRLV